MFYVIQKFVSWTYSLIIWCITGSLSRLKSVELGHLERSNETNNSPSCNSISLTLLINSYKFLTETFGYLRGKLLNSLVDISAIKTETIALTDLPGLWIFRKQYNLGTTGLETPSLNLIPEVTRWLRVYFSDDSRQGIFINWRIRTIVN